MAKSIPRPAASQRCKAARNKHGAVQCTMFKEPWAATLGEEWSWVVDVCIGLMCASPAASRTERTFFQSCGW